MIRATPISKGPAKNAAPMAYQPIIIAALAIPPQHIRQTDSGGGPSVDGGDSVTVVLLVSPMIPLSVRNCCTLGCQSTGFITNIVSEPYVVVPVTLKTRNVLYFGSPVASTGPVFVK